MSGGKRPSIVYTIRHRRQVYVGCTYQGCLNARMSAHRCNPVNRRLHSLLTGGGAYRVQQESVHRSRKLAIQAEARLIRVLKRAGADVLNRFTPGREGAELSLLRTRKRASGKGWARCSLCHLRHTRDYFHSDASRHNGLASRCKACTGFFALVRGRLKGYSGSVAYYAARACIETWREQHYDGPHPLFQ